MKRINSFIIFLIGFVLVAGSAARAELKKVGTLNIRGVFENYQKTVDYDKVLEEQYSKYEKNRESKVEAIKEKQGKLSLLKDAEKGKAEEELQNMINELQEYDREQQTDLTKRRDERIREIMLEIEQFVGNYSEKQGFDLILNSNVLIWQGDNIEDISEEIIEDLNKNYNEAK